MRLIDAEEIPYTMLYKENFLKGTGVEAQGAWKSDIDKIPTIDAVPVRHGKWIRDEFGARCSDCGLYAYRDKFDQPWESPYCPICGASMDEERKDE